MDVVVWEGCGVGFGNLVGRRHLAQNYAATLMRYRGRRRRVMFLAMWLPCW
jgi:hypothetical protein